ncbi:MAG: hypothetical protein ACD_18C00209G0002 [uncultured bacterium]|nr:MAG: hypothetical protein ACD_18C00209G0002 [uncultured bacterium]OGH83622.1 MAG: hypothetical protein A2488_00930 [Candidatus Magasanikbacteria bacterium RIFOXYC12_FULL_32_21b]OGH89056.1 MAG: hypothetical protein A2507_04945 [Candidatus Magasanikbacteria bacterium RIFOXYD12_FULL_33_17]
MFLKKYNIKSRNIPLMYVIGFFGGLLFFLPVLALYFEQSLFFSKERRFGIFYRSSCYGCF